MIFRTLLTDDGFTALFNGKDLSGWKAGDNAGTFCDSVSIKKPPLAFGSVIMREPSGFPKKGFEIQVNNTYRSDPRKTASIYEVKDNHDDIEPDGKWFTEDITVRGDTITAKVDGKVLEEWTQPADRAGTHSFPGRRIAPGTIALPAHDPGSVVHYRNIRIRVLD